MLDDRIPQDLVRWVDELCEGTLSADDECRLAERLRDDPAACLFYVRYLDIHANLGRACRLGGVQESTIPELTTLNDATQSGKERMHDVEQRALLAQIVDRSLQSFLGTSDEERSSIGTGECSLCEPRSARLRIPALWGAFLLLGAFTGSAITRYLQHRTAGDREPLIVHAPQNSGVAESTVGYAATLVNVTNCRWDQARSTAKLSLGSTVRPGDSLHLLEGIAEISSTLKNGGMANLQLEGPVAMTLNSNAMPSLLYGRLTGQFACDFDQFTLDTSLGTVSISGDATVGIVASANRIEIHAFAGTAMLDLWPASVGGNSQRMTTSAGDSLVAHVDATGSISIERGQAREIGFRTPAALAASRLHVADDYVNAVCDSKPLAYWRFENDAGGVMRNEVGDRLHCRIVGDAVRWRPGQDGGTIEFGSTGGPGYLITDDTFDFPYETYTFELWAKPAHFHHATLFSLLQWTPTHSPIGTHRMVMELCGPISGMTSPFRTTDHHPGRIRFIHELHSRYDVDCFSPEPYTVRKWQHFAAVKTPSEMRLYADGKFVDSKAASGVLPKGLRVLMGQLLPVSPEVDEEVTSRLFVGELDEVALYDRDLSDEEIAQRVKLVLPDANEEMHRVELQ